MNHVNIIGNLSQIGKVKEVDGREVLDLVVVTSEMYYDTVKQETAKRVVDNPVRLEGRFMKEHYTDKMQFNTSIAIEGYLVRDENRELKIVAQDVVIL